MKKQIYSVMLLFLAIVASFALFQSLYAAHAATSLAQTIQRATSLTIKNQSSVKYQAADAYLAQGVRVDTKNSGYSGSGYVDNYVNVGATTIFTVTIPSDGNYPVTLHYANGTGATKTLSIYANGIKLLQTALPPTATWNTWADKTENLSLRTGLNTIAYTYDTGDSGNVSLDSMSVTNAIPLAARGATLPYVEYEAEKAMTNGTVIGPDRRYLQLATEASGREAVRLNAQGQYVEFTLTQPANAVDIRYSIPDSADGTGLTAPLSLYVNGARKPDLRLTSKYSWLYGSYPFNNNPGNGKAHRFYDETRVMFGNAPAGSKIRFQMDPGDTASSYTIDLADFYQVPAPYTKPSGYVSITDYGADPSGGNDSSQAVQNAVNAAESQGKGVWIPAGTFTITRHITVDNVTVRGAGPWYSVLHGNGVGVFGVGSNKNIKLYDLSIFGEVTVRVDSQPLDAIGGAMGGGSVIQNIWTEHTKAGIWLNGPFRDLLLVGDTIHDTFADGINLHQGISNTVVEQTVVRNTGDDELAMWAQNPQPDQNDVFRFNTLQLPILANTVGIYGGANNSVTDNLAYDTVTQGAGIHIGNRFDSVPLSGMTTIARNTLTRTGSLSEDWNFGLGAIWLYAQDQALTGNINVTNNEIDDSSYEAIHFIGSSVTNVRFDHDIINTTGTFAIQEQAAGSGQFNYVTATNLQAGGQYNCGTNFTTNKGPGNSGWDEVHCGFPPLPPK